MTTKQTDPPDQTDPDDERPKVDPLDVLTIAELDAGSRQLGASLVAQVSQRGDRYERALAVVLWLHRRRTDRSTNPDELLRQLTKLTFVQLSEQLQQLAEQLAEQGGGEDDPLP